MLQYQPNMATETTMKGKVEEKAAMVRRLSPQAAMKPQRGRFLPTYVIRKQARKLAGISTAPLVEQTQVTCFVQVDALRVYSTTAGCSGQGLGSRNGTMQIPFKWNQGQWRCWNQGCWSQVPFVLMTFHSKVYKITIKCSSRSPGYSKI